MSIQTPLSATPRTGSAGLAERGRTDRADLYAVLDAGFICHLGVICDGAPRVLPTAYGRIDDILYLHGSTANRTILAADGQQVCVTVTHLDGLVCARAVFHHSMNYRSAMVYGTARLVTDERRAAGGPAGDRREHDPGPVGRVRAPTRKEMSATAVLAMPLDRCVGQGPHGASRRRRRPITTSTSGPVSCPPGDLRPAGARHRAAGRHGGARAHQRSGRRRG